MDILSILTIGSQVLPLIIQGINFVEKLFANKSGSGELKKDMVMQFAQVAFSSFTPTDDQEKWDAVKPHISTIIDECVAVMNGLK